MSVSLQSPAEDGEEGAVRASLRLLGMAELTDQEIYTKLLTIIKPK